MCIYTSISCSACQVFVLSVWNVLLTSTVAELFRQTKVNDVELVTTFTDPHEKVVRFDVPMDEILVMEIF